MSGLSRVPSKGSPFHRGSAVLIGALLIVVAALTLEPWAQPAPPTEASASQAPAPSGADSRPTALPPTVRAYEPSAFGPAPTAQVWAVHTPTSTTLVPQVGRPEGEDISSGPVVDLGPADGLDVVVLSGPADSEIREMRLWWFEPGGAPVRMDLDRPRSPWSGAAAWAIGLRADKVADDVVGAWQPGLYRLDLLVGPEPRVRMVMASVGPPSPGGAAMVLDPRAPEPFRLPVLDFLPDAASVWTYGGLLAGWARSSSRADCAVADIWQAGDPKDECWAIPIGRTSALGVNLPDESVESIRLIQVDPLPSSIDSRVDVGIDRRTGLAAVWAPSGSLADGIYAVHARIAGGRSFHWYAEVGPDGRRTESINGLVAGLQR